MPAPGHGFLTTHYGIRRRLRYADGIPTRKFALVNVALIVANFAVFSFYELPTSGCGG
jgi:hypothetical protein